MNRIITFCLLIFSFATVQAKTYNSNTLPVDMQKIRYSRVINPDAILNRETVSAIDTVLVRLERSKGVQALVIAITNIENDDPFQFTLDVFNKYGVGSKDNTGFVLTLATDDRSYQLITGDGLEGSLPDAICKRIENRVMVPYLKEGDWNNAMLAMVQAISDYVQGDETLRASLEEEDDTFVLMVLILIVVFAVGFIFALALYIERKKTYCKICGNYKMRRTRSLKLKLNAHQRRVTETWVCPICGNTETRTHTEDISSNGGGGGVFYGGGSGGSGGRSMGSFGGFGGGHSFGGGAGGRF